MWLSEQWWNLPAISRARISGTEHPKFLPKEAEPRVARLYQKVSSLLENKQMPPNFWAFLENYPAKKKKWTDLYQGLGFAHRWERCELLLSSQWDANSCTVFLQGDTRSHRSRRPWERDGSGEWDPPSARGASPSDWEKGGGEFSLNFDELQGRRERALVSSDCDCHPGLSSLGN